MCTIAIEFFAEFFTVDHGVHVHAHSNQWRGCQCSEWRQSASIPLESRIEFEFEFEFEDRGARLEGSSTTIAQHVAAMQEAIAENEQTVEAMSQQASIVSECITSVAATSEQTAAGAAEPGFTSGPACNARSGRKPKPATKSAD